MANNNKAVNTGNVFNFNNGQLTALPTASGNVAVNTLVANTTPPRAPRVETIDLLGDVLGSAGAGAEKGTGGSGKPTGEVLSKTLGVIGKINDAVSVGQHVVQGNGAETVSEGMGVAGGAGGAAAGFKLGVEVATVVAPYVGPAAPYVLVGIPVVATGIGAYGGSSTLKTAGEYLTGGDTPDKLGPPMTLPNSTPLQPTAVDGSGNAYALVNVDGKFTWFAMLNNNSLPNQFVEVVSGSKVAELTNGYLKEAGFTEQLQDLKTRIDIEMQNGTLVVPDYNFPDTAGAGRGAVNPETVTPPPTAFNAATALPSYSGDHAVTVQPGDTVSSIAKRYDMTVAEFSDYLKDQYGPDADLNSIVAGRKLPIPEQVYERTLGGVNGLDLPPEPSAPTSSTNAPTGTNEAHQQVLDAFGKGDQTAADLKAQYPGVQVADASGGLPNTPNPHSFSNYLDAQGASLTPQQQTALAAQLDKLGLGGEAELSFHSLPGGGALIANADGDIVGEIVQSSSGALNLKASGIDAQGNSVEVNQHISASGQSLTDAQYNAATQQQAGAMFNSLMAAGQWDHLSDLGKLSALVNLYNATDKLGEAFGASGDNLPGDLGAAAGWLSLAQGVEKGDGLIIANAINILSDRALDNALDAAFSNSAASEMAGEAVPYLSYALAIRNFSENPVQAIGTMVGTYAGEAIGMAIGGPIGAAIGGAIGGMLGGMIGDLFGDNDPPPAPEGVVHFSWDASGHIQHTIDFNQSGGGDAADSVADSVQGLLEQVVSAINAKNPSTADDVAINPYLLPKIGFSGSSAWMEVSLPDGSSMREGIHSDSFAQRLLDILQDNGGIAPAWQVQTEQAKWLHAQDQVQQLQAQRDALQETQTVNTEGGPVVQTRIAAGQEERYSALSAQIEQAQAQLADLAQDFKAGIGGQAYAGNTAYSLQGNAAESADFQTQSFGTLVVHLGSDPALQAAQTQLSTQLTQVLRDVEGDGYLEATESLAAKDSTGHLQALLTIDFNGDGIVQTRDILNLGGNKDDSANLTDQARLANQNADLQRNNVQWLDANSDGVLDKRDPAFAAIRLWVDINQDGVQQAGEASSALSQHIASIDFKTGQVTYEDGHRDALTAQTLQADTEGVKLTQIKEVNPDGSLRTLDAGDVLEHEGYQGQVQITDEGGTRWVKDREQTFEQQAKRTGDWEGTAEQDAHRHGGGNVEGAPTETTATGASDLGAVKSLANVTTHSTVEQGDAQVVSDDPTQVVAANEDIFRRAA